MFVEKGCVVSCCLVCYEVLSAPIKSKLTSRVRTGQGGAERQAATVSYSDCVLVVGRQRAGQSWTACGRDARVRNMDVEQVPSLLTWGPASQQQKGGVSTGRLPSVYLSFKTHLVNGG